MNIVVNGENYKVTSEKTVADLLAEMKKERAMVAVERNSQLVPREAHDTTVLIEGDSIEIVSFVGGG